MKKKEILSLGWKELGKGVHVYKHDDGYYLFYDHIPNTYSIYEQTSDCLNRDENDIVAAGFIMKKVSDLKHVMKMRKIKYK